MTIKKPMKAAGNADTAATVAGGATIADRFKLDTSEDAKKAGGKGSPLTVAVGLIALVIAGILTYMLWQHWEFLMPK